MSNPELPKDFIENLTDEPELDFGERATMISDQILLTSGRRIVKDGVMHLEASWKVGFHYHRRFTVSRLAETAGSGTVYHLKLTELYPGMGSGGRYDFSKSEGILASSEGVQSSYDQDAAAKRGISLADFHQQQVLEFLDTEKQRDQGF